MGGGDEVKRCGDRGGNGVEIMRGDGNRIKILELYILNG